MKVIQINSVYNEGSTGKIAADIHTYLIEHGEKSKVLFGRGISQGNENAIRICNNLYGKVNAVFSRISGYMYGGCHLSTERAIQIIENEKPDIVHIQCINGNFINIYKIMHWLNISKIPTVITLHAEFMYTANCGYALGCDKWKTGCGNCERLRQATKSIFLDRTHESWTNLKEAYEGFEQLAIVSVSPWLEKRAKQSPMLSDKRHYVILNGLDTRNIFKHYDADILKRKYGLRREKIVLHVTSFFSNDKEHIKGGSYVLKLAEDLRKYPIKFVVIGKYEKELRAEDNIIFLGEIKDQSKLARMYSMADVTLLTSKRETFSMVTAESLCCGTPVIGFKAGAPEQIAISQYTEFVEYGDVKMLKNTLLKWLETDISDDISQIAANKYDKNVMCKKYFDLYCLQ
ncbi:MULTISPECIES: glycosyltransferase [Eubacteriales]|uniref:glycosyltransferase n=1 Tax=Eubacteriales TaxID=186802 RepID=UPI001106B7BD|nr:MULTISPECIES: glycosyltransferase [Eubacteriales]